MADYVNELTGFPGTKYDDQVDSTAQALDHMRVPSALETWGAFGLDLCSGVRTGGQLDPEKLDAFVEAVRTIDQQIEAASFEGRH